MANVLFIDDDVGLLETHFEYLEEVGGHRVIQAADAARALELLERQASTIDVIVLDIMMPPAGLCEPEEANLGLTTGVVLLGRIRSKLPNVPVVVFTGWGADVVMERMLALGIPEDYYLEKPLGCRELLAVVNQALAG